MMIAIPPKYAVSQVIGFIKGKSAIHLARVYGERKKNFVGQYFWARGYWVSTVGRDEEVIREYIRNEEQEDQRLDQINLCANWPRYGSPKQSGPRQRPRLAALSGSQLRALGTAGGYLHHFPSWYSPALTRILEKGPGFSRRHCWSTAATPMLKLL
jgi:hypothetical protein